MLGYAHLYWFLLRIDLFFFFIKLFVFILISSGIHNCCGFFRTLLTFAPTSVSSVFNFFLLEHISSYFLIKYEMYVFTLPFTNSGSKLQFLVPYGCCGFFGIKRFSVWKFN